MANQIIDQVYILDTASANVAIPIPTKFRINTIRAWFSDTTGKAVLTGANTTQVLCILAANFGPSASAGVCDELSLNGTIISDLKFPTLVVGTVWIYYS